MAIFTFDGVESVESGIIDNRIRLAPDLSYMSNSANSAGEYQRIVNLDASAGLTTALSLTGKFAIGGIGFSSTTPEEITVELTIDDVVIINDTFTPATNAIAIINAQNGNLVSPNSAATIGAVICESSLLLRIQTATNTAIFCNYLARPIL